jgi:hypothetical protein
MDLRGCDCLFLACPSKDPTGGDGHTDGLISSVDEMSAKTNRGRDSVGDDPSTRLTVGELGVEKEVSGLSVCKDVAR